MTDRLTLVPFMTAFFLNNVDQNYYIDVVYPLYDPYNFHKDGAYTTWMKEYDIGDEREGAHDALSWANYNGGKMGQKIG